MSSPSPKPESDRSPPTARLPGTTRRSSATRRYRGFSLIEVMVVMAVIAILVSMAAPSFHRSIEQSHADIAGANLRAIWIAERLYWLDNNTFTTNIVGVNSLVSLDLLDPSVASATEPYAYAITSADTDTFSATATRSGSTVWSGVLSVDETGAVQGAITAADKADIQPGFL